MLQDVRFGIRTLAKSPGFSLVAVLVLALGIGINAAIFSIVNAVLFRPLPVRAPEELRYVYSKSLIEAVPYGISYLEYVDLRDNNGVFSGLLGRSSSSGSLTAGGESAYAVGEAVSGNYFELLGVGSISGRALLREDDRFAASPAVMVISDSTWKRRFKSDPEIIGKQVLLDWKPFTIVGVINPEFTGTGNPWTTTEYWIPLMQDPRVDVEARLLKERGSTWIYAIGRLKPGVSGTQARAFVEGKGLQFQEAYPATNKKRTLILLETRRTGIPFDPSGRVLPDRLALALMAVVGAVLLIAGANVAGILSARGIARSGEIAIRLALGARRWRLVRQLLTESLLLALAGGALGLFLAKSLLVLFIAGTPTQYSYRQIAVNVPLDGNVFLFTALTCIATGILTGLLPALRASNINVLAVLSGGGSLAGSHLRARLRHWIIVPQICFSFALLLLAGIFLRIVLKAELTDPGYNTEHAAFVQFTWKRDFAFDKALRTDYRTLSRSQMDARQVQIKNMLDEMRERSDRFYQVVLERAKVSPGITAASLASSLPLDLPPRLYSTVISRDAYFAGDRIGHGAHSASVSPGYFQAMGIRLIQGRNFDERDQSFTQPVAIISEMFARWVWPGRNPIGEYFTFYSSGSPNAKPVWVEVVGLVNDVRPIVSEGEPHPFVYVLLGQEQNPVLFRASYLVAGGHGSPAEMNSNLRRLVADTDDKINIYRSRTMSEAVRELLFPQRMASAILGTSGLVGLLLACVGLYGVVSYSVARRTREIGIRAAIGAEKSDILRLVIRDGTTAAAIGLVLGLLLSLIAIRMISHYVFAIPALDPVSLVIVPLLLGGTVLLACYLPARRAARIDPLVALREL